MEPMFEIIINWQSKHWYNILIIIANSKIENITLYIKIYILFIYYKMSYHKFLSVDSVKTITLQGIDCLRANTIIDNLIKDGCTIIPSAPVPNAIQIQYISPRINNTSDDVNAEPTDDVDVVPNNNIDVANNYNILLMEAGISAWRFIN
jgi:hypothetical protein